MTSILGRLFKRKVEEAGVVLLAPIDGKIIDVNKVQWMFSQVQEESTFVIEPKEGTIIAPMEGIVSDVDEVFGNISILSANGAEIQIQIGIAPGIFPEPDMEHISILEIFAEPGQKVGAGDVIVKMDLEWIRECNNQVFVSVRIVNAHEFSMKLLKKEEILEKKIAENGKPVVRLIETEA